MYASILYTPKLFASVLEFAFYKTLEKYVVMELDSDVLNESLRCNFEVDACRRFWVWDSVLLSK